MKSVASLFAVTSERCTLEQIEIYDQVLTRLADMVEMEARAFAAVKIAPLRRAPETAIRRFARDDIEVARPVLQQSPVLTDVDLINIIKDFGRDHVDAISTRPVLSEEVTDLAVERGDKSIRAKIAGNHGATIGANALNILIEQAQSDVVTASALGGRTDTPDAVIAQLVDKATEEVRNTLRQSGHALDQSRMASAKKVAQERMSNSYWLGLYDFEIAWAKIRKFDQERGVNEPLLCRLALEDRFAETVACFAVLTGVSLEEAKHWLVRIDTEPFIMVAKAAGFRLQTIQAMLKVGPWKNRLSSQMRTDSLNRFLDLDAAAARERVELYLSTRQIA